MGRSTGTTLSQRVFCGTENFALEDPLFGRSTCWRDGNELRRGETNWKKSSPARRPGGQAVPDGADRRGTQRSAAADGKQNLQKKGVKKYVENA